VLGRLTENRTETAVLKKPTTEPTSVFKKPVKTENRLKKTEKTDKSVFSASMLAIGLICQYMHV
jgi:hypothetical protein